MEKTHTGLHDNIIVIAIHLYIISLSESPVRGAGCRVVLCLCVSYDIITGKLLNGTNVRAARSSQSSPDSPASDRNVSPGLTIPHWPIYREEECGYKVFEAF